MDVVYYQLDYVGVYQDGSLIATGDLCIYTISVLYPEATFWYLTEDEYYNYLEGDGYPMDIQTLIDWGLVRR